MLTEISSTIKSIIELFEIFKNRKIKSIFIFLVALSIALVKPAVYYITLYTGFCKIICTLLILIILICILAALINKCLDIYYDTETLKLIVFFSAVLIGFIVWGLAVYEMNLNEVFENANMTKEGFIEEIHKTPYFEVFYNYVSNNLLYVLLYCINFFQMVAMINFFLVLIKSVNDTEKPFTYGFPPHV